MLLRGGVQLFHPDQFLQRNRLLFDSTRVAVLAVLPAARVEHVGASAINGAWSKGDLDVCVVVAAEHHEAAVALLQARGWQVKPDTLRDEQLCMLESQKPDQVALQLIAAGSRYQFFMTFRDLLNADARLVERYNSLKRRHIDSGDERYRAAKNAFIEQVLRSAPGARSPDE